MADLGKTNRLVILRESDHGFYLDGGRLGEILLPRREIPPEVEQGDEVEVFVSRDSEDRLVATTRKPVCEAGDFAVLEVVSVHPDIGAFLDWGLEKELLLPFREQPYRVRPGQRVLVRVVVDERSGRLAATARTRRHLDSVPPRYLPGDEVDLLVMEEAPEGYYAIVEQRCRGLIPRQRVRRRLQVGERLVGYIAEMKEDGKIDLSLEPVGFSRITDLSDRILETLRESGGRLGLDDKSPPEEIARVFGASKKAYKQALGTLYRKKRIRFLDGGGVELAEAGKGTPPRPKPPN